MNGVDPLSRVRVVLSHPSHPGNIGAAARAMKTMGVTRLTLVAPRHFPSAEATARASGATDVLDSAAVCPNLAAALQGTVLAAALTSRKRELAAPTLWLRDAARDIVAHAAHGDVALVFGSETFGLSNAELALCQMPVMIPANPEYASLNLGAAVQLACYELRMAAASLPEPPQGMEFDKARSEEVEAFLGHLERAMTASGFFDPANPKRLMPRLRRLFARSRLEKEEINILRGMLRSFLPKVD